MPEPSAATAVEVTDKATRLATWRRPGSSGSALSAAALVALFAVAAGLPLGVPSGLQRIFGTALMFVALAQAWNLLGGYVGYPSFGHVFFLGTGAYITAIMMVHLRLSVWATLPVATAFGAASAAVIGLPLLRLKGHYFAVAMLGVATAMGQIVLNLPGLTGGDQGINLPVLGTKAVSPYLGDLGFYYLFLALAVAATLTVLAVSRSKLGFAMGAIRQDERTAASIGINTVRTKVLVFAVSGAMAGLVGACFGFQQSFFYPTDMFDPQYSLLMVVMVLLGGPGTVAGPVFGAIGLELLSYYLNANYTNLHNAFLGVLVVLVVLLVPNGVLPFIREGIRTKRVDLLAAVRRSRL